jgi:histone chaperone ASF1
VTVILITAIYKNQEFVRVGYYVNNDYEESELKENPPIEPIFSKLIRTIASDEPRVTKFKINWDSDLNNIDIANTCETQSNKDQNQQANEQKNNLNSNNTEVNDQDHGMNSENINGKNYQTV